MSFQQLEQVLRTVPMVASLGITVDEGRPGSVVLKLPSAPGLLDAQGRLHTSALFAVGELAAAVALGTHPKLSTLAYLHKASRIAYVSSVRGDVLARAEIPPELVGAVVEGLERDARFVVEVSVSLLDARGNDVAHVVSVFTFKRA